ncbi:MAG: histidine phosphatase family protein [Myxococcota bacterium]
MNAESSTGAVIAQATDGLLHGFRPIGSFLSKDGIRPKRAPAGFRRIPVILLGLVLLGAGSAGAEDADDPEGASPEPTIELAGPALVEAIRDGGFVLYLRHMETDRGRPDAEQIDLADCATQRVLSAEGRGQADRIGRALTELSVPVGAVWSSPYCRCRDTAMLAFGGSRTDDALRYARHEATAEREALAEALRERLSRAPADGTNTVLVSHSTNMLFATGVSPRPEGALYVFRPEGAAGFRMVGRILPDQWERLLVQVPAREGASPASPR